MNYIIVVMHKFCQLDLSTTRTISCQGLVESDYIIHYCFKIRFEEQSNQFLVYLELCYVCTVTCMSLCAFLKTEFYLM